MRAIILSIAASILLSGCASSICDIGKSPCGSSDFGRSYSHKRIDFSSMMSDAVSKIASQTALKGEAVVTDFVDVENLSNKNKLGFMLSSSLKSELAANKKLKITEVETAKYFKIGSDGVTLLTRDKSESLKDELGVDFAFVGTYAVTDERVIAYVRLINLSNGKIEAAATVEEPMSCEIIDIVDSKKVL